MIEDDYNGSHIVRGIEGIDKTITCTIISGVPNNESLTLSTKSKILTNGGPGHVFYSFKPTKTDHQENITCTANHISTKAPITYSVILYLTLTPVVTIDVFPKRTVIEGQTLIISCRDENSASTNNSVLFTWHHNYRKLDTTSPHLKFESIAKPDEGNYSCCASNKAGTGIEIVTITVMADVRTNRTFFVMASISGCSCVIVCIIASLLCYICKGRNDLESSRNLNYIDVQLGSFRENQSRIRGIENRTEYADINFLAPAVDPLSSSSSNSDENSDDDFMYIGHDIEVENSL